MFECRSWPLVLIAIVACSDEDETTTTISPLTPADEQPAADVLARGEYLVRNVGVCSDCHTPRDTMGQLIQAQYLAGAECFVRAESGGCLNTSNLTNHPTGLMNRTDAEIKRILVDGIRTTPAGDEVINPVMMSYTLHNLRDADVDAIIAYLRTVPGVEHDVPPRAAEFVPPGPVNPLDVEAVPQPAADYPEREAAIRGRYYAAEVGACIICHSPRDLASPNVLIYGQFFTGNETFDVGLPEVSVAHNITSDVETGIGDYDVADILEVIQGGVDKGGDGICPPMLGLFAGLTEEDASDIAHYIKSLAAAPGLGRDGCVFGGM